MNNLHTLASVTRAIAPRVCLVSVVHTFGVNIVGDEIVLSYFQEAVFFLSAWDFCR
jgi:hypothetical protein